MNDKLRKILGLDRPMDELEPKTTEEVAIEGGDDAPAPASAEITPTVLKLDSWGMARGESLLNESSVLQKMKHLGEEERPWHAVSDFFGAAFEVEPALADGVCESPDRQQFMQSLLATPDYRALHQDTYLDMTASEIASVAFAQQYEVMMQAREERRKEEPKDKKDSKEGEAGEGKKDKKDGKDGAEESFKAGMEAAGAAAAACAAAAKEVADYKDACEACGMGEGSDARANPARIASFYQRMRNNTKLRRIFELAGKFRRLARSKQRQKTAHGYDDLMGIKLSDEVARMLPVELAMLAHPVMKLDAYRRLAEKQMMCLDYRTVEPVAAGPVIVCVDQSGSMDGTKGEAAMAVALAMAWIARTQKRWCALLAFTGQDRNWKPLVGTSSAFHNSLILPMGRWNESAMLVWLDSFLGRGSHMDVPVREMPGYYNTIGAPKGKTDVIFITDAICSINEPDTLAFTSWKKSAKARLISLVIGSRHQPTGSLADVSDEVYSMPSLSLDEEGIGAALSI